MKVMVVGGTGFIGSNLTHRLVDLGYKVVDISKHEKLDNNDITYYKQDIADNKGLEPIFKKERPDIVINEAGIVYWEDEGKDPIKDIQTTVIGTINLLNNCVKYNVKKFIFASSISVYGEPKKNHVSEEDPVNFEDMPDILFSYGFTKYSAERYIIYFHKLYGIKYTILRYTHIFGPGQKDDAIAKFLNKAINNEKIVIYGDGEQCRDYLFVDDAVEATILSIKKGDNTTLNIGSGEKTSVNELVRNIIEITKLKINYSYDNEKKDTRKTYMDISLAKKELDWEPTISLKEGIIRTYRSRALNFLK